MSVVYGEWCETCGSIEPVAFYGGLNRCDTCGTCEDDYDYEDGDE